MKDTIKLISRGEEHNYLKLLKKVGGGNSSSYLLKTTTTNMQVGYKKGNMFIIPSGGPEIAVGELLEDANMVVNKIDFIAGTGYIITFDLPIEEQVDKMLEL